MDNDNNNLGIAMLINREKVLVVEILAKSAICVTKLDYGEERGLKLYGKMLDPNFGIYAVKLTNSMNKETITIIDPLNIEYDSMSREWIATIIGKEQLGSSQKHL